MSAPFVWDAYSPSPSGLEVLESLAGILYPQEMDTHQLREENRRKDIVAFWRTHGLVATNDAYSVSRATLFRWQKDATPLSTMHRSGYIKRIISPLLSAEIYRIRSLHPRLGKEKLTPLLKLFCTDQGISVPAEPTVGRILKQLKAAGKLPTGMRLGLSGKTGKLLEKKPLVHKKKLRRNGYVPTHPGDFLQVDGVLTFAEGIRRYTFTAVDLISRWAYSYTYPTASSRNGAHFLTSLIACAPFTVHRIQTDNGSEFQKEFEEAVATLGITRFFNWVRQPKYQGWVERFNRTIQEEFIDHHLSTLAGPTPLFNTELATWLTWYNTERVHRSLGTSCHRLTPLAYLSVTKESQTG